VDGRHDADVQLPSEVTSDEEEMLKVLIPIEGVRFLDVDSRFRSVRVSLETLETTATCPACGKPAELAGRLVREHVAALPAFGKTCIFEWHARRWRCADPSCASVFEEADPVERSGIRLVS
jgi:transposase